MIRCSVYVKGGPGNGRSVEPLRSEQDQPMHIGLLCFIVHRSMEERVLDDLARAGFDDISAAQARVFARIGPNGTRVSQLAEQARITKQTAGFLVDQLERAGYVRRTADPH